MECRDHPGKTAFANDGAAAAALKTIRRHTKRGAHIPVRYVRCDECHDRFLTSTGKEGRWV